MEKQQQIFFCSRQAINLADIHEVSEALSAHRQGMVRGSKVAEFEQKIADYCGAQYGVAFNSGTSALMAACYAANLGPCDRVLTTPNASISPVSAVLQRGATPVFMDIDHRTGNLDLEQLKENVNTPHSRGRTVILPVHFSGIPVDMQFVDQIICDPESLIIEDASQALGSCYKDGQKVGSCAWSHMTTFSFHSSRMITTGEGGMVTTNDELLFRRLKLFRNNGQEKDPQKTSRGDAHCCNEAHELSGHYHFTDFQAALGLSQLSRLDQFLAKRRELVHAYRQLLKPLPHFTLFNAEFDQKTGFNLFVVQIDFAAYKTTRAEVMGKLKEKGVETEVYDIPVYQHPAVKKNVGDIKECFPKMEKYYMQTLSLPLYPDLHHEEISYIAQTLKTILKIKTK